MRRRAGESFLVGAEVEIEVLEVCGTRVKLGIVAPDSVPIQRKETQITRAENIIAARSVRRRNITSLLNKFALQPAEAPVKKELDECHHIDGEMHSVFGGKNTRTVPVRPRYESVKG
jgi:carbon storage regulator